MKMILFWSFKYRSRFVAYHHFVLFVALCMFVLLHYHQNFVCCQSSQKAASPQQQQQLRKPPDSSPKSAQSNRRSQQSTKNNNNNSSNVSRRTTSLLPTPTATSNSNNNNNISSTNIPIVQPIALDEQQLFGGRERGAGKGLSNRDHIYEFIKLVAESSAANCSENKNVIMPDGIIKQYGFNSFHDQALVGVNRANMLARLWKYAPELMYRDRMQAQYLLYTSVRSAVEQNDFIYAAGNCYINNSYDGFAGLFCPYAWRHRPTVLKATAPPTTAAAAQKHVADSGQLQQGASFLLDHISRSSSGDERNGRQDAWSAQQLENAADEMNFGGLSSPTAADIPPTVLTHTAVDDNEGDAGSTTATRRGFTTTAIAAAAADASSSREHIWVKDLSREYSYSFDTDWIREAYLKAENFLRKAETNIDAYVIKGFNRFRQNNNTMTDPIEETILPVGYEHGHWSKPYFDCGGGNIWMMTYMVGFFGFDHDRNKYYVKGFSGIDIELQNVDIDQCPSKNLSTVNVFADTARCHKETTQCEHVGGRGFIIGSYVCVCKPGFYFPDAQNPRGFFNGTAIELEYSKMRRALPSDYNSLRFKCLPCAEGCETCVSGEPCVIQLDWTLRTALLVITMLVMGYLPVLVWFTIQLRFLRVVKAASPMLLIIILAGAFLLYGPVIVMYPVPTVYSCTAKFWLREVGFCISYGALLLKTWRIASVFHVRSAQRIRITDMNLIKRLCFIVSAGVAICAVRTIVDLPQVEIGRTEDGKKARMCSMGWGDHTLFMCEMCLLLWGIKLCFSVRKAPSEFNESKFISWAIYNETLLSLFLNISMIFLKYPANPDLVYILHFVHSQLTITVVLGLLFGSKAYMIYKGQGAANQEHLNNNTAAAAIAAVASAASSSGNHHYTHHHSGSGAPLSDMSTITSVGNNSSHHKPPTTPYGKQSSGGASTTTQQFFPMPTKTNGGRRFVSGVTPGGGGGASQHSNANAADGFLLPNHHHHSPKPEDDDIQEELRRFYMQLELLRLQTMRQNNPALSRSIRQMSSAFHYFMNDYLHGNNNLDIGSNKDTQNMNAQQIAAAINAGVPPQEQQLQTAASNHSAQKNNSLPVLETAAADLISSSATTTTQSEQSRSSD